MILHISHNDLDGAGCGIVINSAIREVESFYMNYDEVDNFLISNYNNYSEIIITDLSPNIETYQKIAKEKRITLIDHHKTSVHFKKFDNVIHDLNYCATYLTYKWLIDNYDVTKYHQFVILVNDYDLWHLKKPHSLKLNQLFYILGLERFVKRFLNNPSTEFMEHEQLMLDIEDEKQKKYLENCESHTQIFTDKNNRTFGVVFAEIYNSELGHYLIKKLSLDYIFIINMQKKKISLRSKPEIDVSVIAKANGGGGHKNAAGFSTDFDFCLNDFLKQTGVL